MMTPSPELRAALRLVDEMVDCNAQLHANLDGPRRADLEASIAERAAKIQWYLDATEVFATPTNRLAYETDTINRALQHDLVLFGSVTRDSELVFHWRAASGIMSQRFDDRERAIDWIAQWLDEDAG